MVYGRRYRKRNYRRKRTLGTYNIASKTSAKSQARQIYALNKRVTRIYRMTRPDIQIGNAASVRAVSITGGTNTGSVEWNPQGVEGGGTRNYINPYMLANASSSVGSAALARSLTSPSVAIGDWQRLRSFTLYGNLQYTNISISSAPIVFRVIIAQQKQSRGATIAADDIFNRNETSGANISYVYGPLQSGVTATCNILSDKRYILSYQRPNVSIVSRIRRLSSSRRDAGDTNDSTSSSTDSIYRGTIYVFYAWYTIIPVGDETIAQANFNCKLAWTN